MVTLLYRTCRAKCSRALFDKTSYLTMETTDSESKQSTQQNSTLFEDILEHTTTVIHVLALGLTLFIIYLCFQDDVFYSRTWHVLLYTIGWFFLVTEGILYFAKGNILSKRSTTPMKIRTHWIVITIGVSFSIAGFCEIFYNKNKHFTSIHGIVGLVSGILGCLSCISGIPALFSHSLRKKIPPKWSKLFHGFLGFSAVIFGTSALIIGSNKKWFKEKTTESAITCCCVITLIVTTWTLLKPLINIYVRIKNICN